VATRSKSDNSRICTTPNLQYVFSQVNIDCVVSNGIPCKDLNPSIEGCIVPIVYTYMLSNVGTTDMDITVLQRTHNGVPLDLFSLVTPNQLAPGDTAPATEVENLDICVGAVYITTVDAGANTPGGVPCFVMDEFILFEISLQL
jgi:hypothetical protein